MQILIKRAMAASIIAIILLTFAKFPLAGEAQEISSYEPPSHVTVRMYRLVSPIEAEQNPLLRVGEIHPSKTLCSAQNITYGCTVFVDNINYPYPYENDNPVFVPVETDYLLAEKPFGSH